MQILKGDISITDNIQFVREILYSNIPNTKIISLDETNSSAFPKFLTAVKHISGVCTVLGTYLSHWPPC